jgi:heptosyltransferase-2
VFPLKKILVIQTAFIGDTILATAVLEHVRKHLPQVEVDVLVRKGNESLFASHPFVAQTLVWDKKNAKYRNLLRLIRAIRKEQYDAVINLQRHTASAIMTVLSGAKQTSGFDENFLSRFFTFRIKHRLGKKGETDYRHEVQRCIELTKPWTPQEITLPKLYPSEEDVKFIERYSQESFITISPSSVWFTKQTPIEVWQKLIGSVKQTIYLLGAPSDDALCHQLADRNSHVHVLAGKLTLLQSAALMSKAHMNFTNDSAPLHLCSAVNAPVTAVFCSTLPEFGFGPLSQQANVVQTREQLSCKPCGIHGRASCPQGHFKCGAIEVNQLLQTIQ